MKTKLGTILNIVLISLMVVSALLTIVFYFGTSLYGSETAFSEQISILGWRLNMFINWAYLLIIVGTTAAIIFPLIQMVTNPKGSKKSFMLIALMAVAFLMAYLLASPEILKFPGSEKFFTEGEGMSPATFAKLVDAGLLATYILFALAIGSILYSQISKLLK